VESVGVRHPTGSDEQIDEPTGHLVAVGGDDVDGDEVGGDERGGHVTAPSG
jgi:hypothetical protein